MIAVFASGQGSNFEALAQHFPNQISALICNVSLAPVLKLAEKYHTRIIYRNNHFNRRFGTICADAEFESMIYGSNWEIWNNREMSRDSWVEVCYNVDSCNDVKYHIIYCLCACINI